MELTQYPLHIIHEYAIPRPDAEGFLEVVAGQSRRSLDRIAAISRRRLEALPVAALILHRLIASRQTPAHRVLGLRVARRLRFRAVAGRARGRTRG